MGLTVLVVGPVGAHDLGVEVHLRGDTVEVQVFFDDDSPAAKAQIIVTDLAKTIVAQGQADTAGRWSFAAPPPGTYHVTADSGDGHRQTVTLTVPDVGRARPVVQGDHRREFTRLRWKGLALGLLILAALPLATRVLCRRASTSDHLLKKNDMSG